MKVALIGLSLVALVGVGYTLAKAGSLMFSWGQVERVSLGQEPAELGGASDENPAQAAGDEVVTVEASAPPQVMALIGTDTREGLDDLEDFGSFDTQNADVILLAIRHDEDLTLLSVPRDLYVEDSCDGGMHKIAESYLGCDGGAGLASVVGELEELTGLDIPHAAAIDFAGFQAVVDELGGYEICTDHALRDTKSGLDLDAGCTVADGETTLMWLRSRHTERLEDGTWRTEPGVSDLTRNERQREFLLDMFDQVTTGARPDTMIDLVGSVVPFLTIDDGLSLQDLASWGWELRSADLETAAIPVEFSTADSGASILVPTVDVPDYIASLDTDGTATLSLGGRS